jgi:antitoxin VapB
MVDMALNIKNAEAEALIRRLAEQTGEDLTTAVIVAVRERIARQGERRDREAARLTALADRIAALPVRDGRPADELIGYDERGLW